MKTEFVLKGILILCLGILTSISFFNIVNKIRLDLKNKLSVIVQVKPLESDGSSLNMKEAIEKFTEVTKRRTLELGLKKPIIRQIGSDKIRIEVKRPKDIDKFLDIIGKTAILEFKLYKNDNTLGETVMTGKEITEVSICFDRFERPEIHFKLSPKGKKLFADITRLNIGKRLAMILDGKKLTEPTIQSEIPEGRGVITGQFTVEEAKEIEILLNSGALPLKVTVLEVDKKRTK